VFRNPFVPGAIALALFAPAGALAADSDIEAIRKEIRDLRQSYEARIQALEQRLQDAESRATQAQAQAQAQAAAPAAPPSSPASSLNAFNPAVSVVLQGRYANFSQPSNEKRGFSLAESELSIFANVDDKFAGNLTFSISPDNEVEVEEAYGRWLTAPYGLAPKFGRFLSGIGYLNEQHQHVWDFIDAPLAYNAFLGEQYKTDGLQVKWVAPIETFVELGGEVGSGDAFPGAPRDKNGSGSGALYAHVGGDIGTSHSWRAGLSQLQTRNEAGEDVRVGIADFIWKWAPEGNAQQTNFKVQGEYFRGSGSDAIPRNGWYLQGVYQFMPMWRVGARYDRLEPAGASDYRPERYSVMVDYSPSEFSRFRLQAAQAKLLPDLTDNQFFVQYILSLGAHGAHRY
jgi:hypothetical protein